MSKTLTFLHQGWVSLFPLLVLASGCTPVLSETLEGIAYTELRPASTLTPPGAVVAVENDAPFVAGLICTQVDALGSTATIVESAGASRQIGDKLNREFTLSADYLSQIKADARYSKVSDISLTLSNVKILEVTDAELFRRLPSSMDSGCREAIQFRRRNGEEVTMIKSVISADVVYKVSITDEASLSAAAKQGLLKGLSLSLGAESVDTSTSTISGNGLYWGIREDSGVIVAAAAGTLGGPDAAPLPPSAPVISTSGIVTVLPLMQRGNQ